MRWKIERSWDVILFFCKFRKIKWLIWKNICRDMLGDVKNNYLWLDLIVVDMIWTWSNLTYSLTWFAIKKRKHHSSKQQTDFFFQFGDTPFFDIWKFLDGASIQFSFLKAYRASVINVFLPDEWLHKPGKLDFPELWPYKTFFSKLRNNNTLDRDPTDYEKLQKSELCPIWLGKLQLPTRDLEKKGVPRTFCSCRANKILFLFCLK